MHLNKTSCRSTVCDDAGRSSDGENVPVSVDCARFHYVEPPADWNTVDEETFTVDGEPSQDLRVQRTGNAPTGSVHSKSLPQLHSRDQGQSEGEGPIAGVTGPQNPDTSSTENDNTGDVVYITVIRHHRHLYCCMYMKSQVVQCHIYMLVDLAEASSRTELSTG